jgi:hypothetical protein
MFSVVKYRHVAPRLGPGKQTVSQRCNRMIGALTVIRLDLPLVVNEAGQFPDRVPAVAKYLETRRLVFAQLQPRMYRAESGDDAAAALFSRCPLTAETVHHS